MLHVPQAVRLQLAVGLLLLNHQISSPSSPIKMLVETLQAAFYRVRPVGIKQNPGVIRQTHMSSAVMRSHLTCGNGAPALVMTP